MLQWEKQRVNDKSDAMSPAVPFVDLQREHNFLRNELHEAFARVLNRGDFVLGEEVELFERDFAGYIGVQYAVGVASGTSAITIGLLAAGIGPGDEVIVPAHTYIASALGVVHAGAKPVFCDVEEGTGLIDLASAESMVGAQTSAMLIVHLYGQACDMDQMTRFARRHRITLFEDAAQAHGARWRGRRVGSFGNVASFSFFPSKNLGAMGDGGMLCTNDPEIAATARCLRHLGQRAKGEHVVAGFNERLDTLQAAILRIKLRRLDEGNQARREIARIYRELLPASAVTLPQRDAADDVYHLFPIRVSDRDRIAGELKASGIGSGIHYSPAVHQQPPFADHQCECPVAGAWAREELSMPMFPGLTETEVHRTCKALAQAAS
jgi:dTDP-4-amino-4,6-dideoxygalactose transaminase